MSAVGQRIVKILERRLPEGQSAQYLLPVLSNVISLSPESLTEGKCMGRPGITIWLCSDEKAL